MGGCHAVAVQPPHRAGAGEPPDSGFLVSLPDGPQYTNHLGTVHAAALLAVAEAGSGAFLVRHLGSADGLRAGGAAAGGEVPQAGVRAGCRRGRRSPPEEVARWSAELAARGRVSAAVPVEVVDAAGVVVLSAVVEWFIVLGSRDAEPAAAPDRGGPS